MKIFKYLFLIFVLFVGINVYAEVPSPNGYIRFNNGDYTYTYLYSNTETQGTVDNVTYDLDNNTLIFNNYNIEQKRKTPVFDIYNMGDITVKFVGDNSINLLYEMGNMEFFQFDGENDYTITIETSGSLNYTANGVTFLSCASSGGLCNININNANINLTAKDTNYGATFLFWPSQDSTLIINNSNIELHGSFDISTVDTIINNSVFNAVGGSCQLTNIKEINDSTVNIRFCGLDAKYIKNSTINIVGEGLYLSATDNYNKTIENSTINIEYATSGLNGGEDGKEIIISNSYLNIKPLTGTVLEEYIRTKGDMYDDLSVFDYKIAIFSLNASIKTEGTTIVEGGNIYSSCGGEQVFGEKMCIYYSAEEEVEDFINIYIRIITGQVTETDKETIKQISNTIIISDPVPNQIINNVPNTGVIAFIWALIGLIPLILGIYLIKDRIKRTN